MGGWELWGALIVGAAVWIIGHLLRQSAEESSRRGPIRPPNPEDRRPRPNAPAGRPQSQSDLDRFLQEVARRKQAAEQQRGREEPARQGPVRRPNQPRPPSSGQPRRRAQPGTPQVIPVEPVRQRPSVDRPLETVVPVVQPARTELVPTVLPVEPLPVALPAPAARARALFPPTQRQVPTPALQKLAAVFRSRENLRAGMILREVLDPPLAHRRRGRS
jgi:hypothetical protein